MRRIFSVTLVLFLSALPGGASATEQAPGANGAVFDRTGPGSAPLDQAAENRLGRYINNDKCPVTLDVRIHDRCDFLLRLTRFERQQAVQMGNARLRSRGILDGTEEMRRDVGGAYHRSITDTVSAIRVQKKQGGLMLRPRTLDEAADQRGGTESLPQGRRALRRSLEQTAP